MTRFSIFFSQPFVAFVLARSLPPPGATPASHRGKQRTLRSPSPRHRLHLDALHPRVCSVHLRRSQRDAGKGTATVRSPETTPAGRAALFCSQPLDLDRTARIRSSLNRIGTLTQRSNQRPRGRHVSTTSARARKRFFLNKIKLAVLHKRPCTLVLSYLFLCLSKFKYFYIFGNPLTFRIF